jgi:CheY-like chemotaxis protein
MAAGKSHAPPRADRRRRRIDAAPHRRDALKARVEVQLAGTCEQALRLAESYAYDAILLDLMMPGIGGFGVLFGVRRSAPNAATPVIIVSVVAEKAAIARCMAAGANAFVAKPLQFAELANTVKKELAAGARGSAKSRVKPK